MREPKERGSLSGIAVSLVLSLMTVAGLTFDGGRVVDAYGEVSSLAASTARLGGQELVGVREGDVRIDVERARDVMSRYLAMKGIRGKFTVDEQQLSVTISRSVRMQWLSIIGFRHRTISVTRTAFITQG